MERYFGQNVEDVEQTERNRSRRGWKQNGRLKRSPIKQRQKISNAYIHHFKHNEDALKSIERARQRLDKLVADERATVVSPIISTPGSSASLAVAMSSPSFGSTPGAMAALRNLPYVEGGGVLERTETSGIDKTMSVDEMGDSGDVFGHPAGYLPTGRECGEHSGADWDPITVCPSPSNLLAMEPSCAMEVTSTQMKIPLQVKDTQEVRFPKSSTPRNVADNRHWTVLLPRLRKSYLQMTERRHASATASFVSEKSLFSNCICSCTCREIKVDCLFLECEWRISPPLGIINGSDRQERDFNFILCLRRCSSSAHEARPLCIFTRSSGNGHERGSP
jgi:hypothetical protein